MENQVSPHLMEELHDSQRRETVKYGHEPAGLGTKNDCAGEDQQQFTFLSISPIGYVFGTSSEPLPRAEFSWFYSVFKETMRWFPRFKVATTCFSIYSYEIMFIL
jgi:hypothetical protein